jgi:hypothetical protein
MNESTARNIRVQDRYDELMRIGKHGHYETMFQVVREETESLRQQLAAALAATADPKGAILCHAEPVGWCGTSGVGEFIVSKSKVWNFLTTPLYRAWEPK